MGGNENLKNYNLPKGVFEVLASLPEEVDTNQLPSRDNIESFRSSWSECALPKNAGPLAKQVNIKDYESFQLNNNPVPIRIFEPEAANSKIKKPVILCTSGGGFVANYLSTNQTPWSKLALETNCPVITYNYTPAPEGNFDGINKPKGIQEAESIIKWLVDNSNLLGFNNNEIFLVGDSSGANFSIYQAIFMHEMSIPAKKLTLISPAVDISRCFSEISSVELEQIKEAESIDKLLSDEMVKACYNLYSPDPSKRQDPRISPLYIPDLSDKLPITTIIVASCDRLKRDSVALHHKLIDSELYILPGTHAFLTVRALFGEEPGPDPAILASADIADFLHNSVTEHSRVSLDRYESYKHSDPLISSTTLRFK